MGHECIQQENIGALKEAADTLKDAIERLDTRINGSFKQIGDHINESPVYRSKIEVLEREVSNMKEERLNTVKASQWRIGLIVGVLMGLMNIIAGIWLKILK